MRRVGYLPIKEEEMKKWNHLAMFFLLITLLCLVDSGAAYSGGKMTALGTLGGTSSWAYGINNNGQIVGSSHTATGSAFSGLHHAFLYSGGKMTDLGTLPGGSTYRYLATGINNNGKIVGYSYTDTSAQQRGFLYSDGVMTDLGTLGGRYTYANGINNNGQIVGYSETATGNVRAFLYFEGEMKDLGTLFGTNGGPFSSRAHAINDSGQVVGRALLSGAEHAFLYSGNTMKDLGTLGGNNSYAWGINNNGQIVGSAEIATGVVHAFLYSGDTMIDLGALPGLPYSRATGINNNGQIVGYSETLASFNTGGFDGQRHAFLYSGGTMKDLGTLGGVFSEAYGINDKGQIVGFSNPAVNSARKAAFLYNPQPISLPPIQVLLLGSD
jgi:probable HAF family extracellular repeat protein